MSSLEPSVLLLILTSVASVAEAFEGKGYVKIKMSCPGPFAFNMTSRMHMNQGIMSTFIERHEHVVPGSPATFDASKVTAISFLLWGMA